MAGRGLRRLIAHIRRLVGSGEYIKYAQGLSDIVRRFRSFAFCGIPGTWYSDERERHFAAVLAERGEACGRAAASAMLSLLAKDGHVVPGMLLTVPHGEIASRESTDVWHFASPWLGEALRFIRINISRNITAAEVCSSVGMSHAAVGAAFRRELGRSVQDEIKAVRMEEAAHLRIEPRHERTNHSCDMTVRDHDRVFLLARDPRFYAIMPTIAGKAAAMKAV